MDVILSSFLLVCLFLTPNVSEKVCSKFAYEEQLLEKMVRVEFNVGQMEKEIKSTNNLVLESLQKLKENWEKIAEESEALKAKVRKVLNANEENVSKEIDDLRAERSITLEEYSDKITECEASVTVPNIAFKARSPSLLDPIHNEVIVFTTNIVNIGNAYDNATGIFTAPIDGTYLFTSQLCLVYGKAIACGIYIDDVLYTVGTFYEKYGHVCYNIETTAAMKSNQTASVKSLSSSAGNVLYEDGHRWSMFSGTLIHK